jgi:hypothetical protein
MRKRVIGFTIPLPISQVPRGQALSDSEKAEALANSVHDQFEPVNDPSEPEVVEIVDEAMCAYEHTLASEPKLTSPTRH